MSKKPLLMVVEDDIGIREQLQWCFEEFEVIQAGDRHEAITKLKRFDPAIITLDLGLPPDTLGVEEGMATLNEILRLKSTAKVIMVTGQSDRTYALQAINLGAYDFYLKPIHKEELNFIANREYYLYQLEAENTKLEYCR
ncbi:MAG TPA: response regulator, partial [Gammaproteobacteria bacterium]|nr:response regulator [Gammaproteobacteria bacterium]